jgi:hypothetical protein
MSAQQHPVSWRGRLRLRVGGAARPVNTQTARHRLNSQPGRLRYEVEIRMAALARPPADCSPSVGAKYGVKSGSSGARREPWLQSKLSLILAALILPWLPRLEAATVVLRPAADTTLIETAPNNNMGGQLFFNAGTTQNGTRNHGLLQFDFTGVIPEDAAVQSAVLYLTVVSTPPPQEARASLFGVYRVLQPWGEGTKVPENPFSPGLGAPATVNEATWNDRFAGTAQAWSSPGGEAGIDFIADPSSMEYIEDEQVYPFNGTPLMVADVQSWIDGSAGNYGWILKTLSDDPSLPYTSRRFGSREDEFSAPWLTVTYEMVPEPAAWTLWSAGLLAGFGRPRGKRRAKDLFHTEALTQTRIALGVWSGEHQTANAKLQTTNLTHLQPELGFKESGVRATCLSGVTCYGQARRRSRPAAPGTGAPRWSESSNMTLNFPLAGED